jgi:predicted Zn-dependent peptidase
LNFVPSASSLKLPVTRLTLENGLTLIHHYIPGCGVTAVDVWVKAGAVVEPDAWTGMAHFLEHMIFKGSDRIPPGRFDQIIENRGGMTNAATSYDYAHFFIVTAAQDLAETLPYLGEILLHPAIPKDEFEREREVVLEEILQTYDDPDSVGFERLLETVYQRHPYGRSILGSEAILMQRSPDEMRDFHRTHYQPHNMTVVIVGDVSPDRATQLVARSFTDFQTPAHCPQSEVEAEPPITQIRRQELSLPRLEHARLMMAWLGPGVESLEPEDDSLAVLPWKRSRPIAVQQDPLRTAAGLDLLSAILAEGRSSRLVQELREDRQLVHGISSGFTLQRDSSFFTISAWLDAENLERVEALICDRLSQLMTLPVTEVELARAKRLLCNDYAFSIETPAQMAGLYGYYHTMADLEAAFAYPDWIQSLPASAISDLTSQYLSPYHYAAVVMQPASPLQ